MLVTLFTDASWCPHTGLAGWAAWWKYEGRAETHSGPLREAMKTSGHAEMAALVNGLWCVHKAGLGGARIIAQSDCEEALGVLSGRLKIEPHDPRKPLKSRALQIIAAGPFKIDWRHVKGHRGHRDPRSSVNTWCDRAAKAGLAAAREKSAPPAK